MSMASGSPPPRRPQRPARRRASSLVLLNTGDGKGKTTAALGTALRALARGWPVAVVQFIKSGRWKVGEEAALRRLGADWWTIGDGFSWESPDLERSAAIARSCWRAARERIGSADYKLVVLDEITYPINWGWIAGEEVAEVIRGRPAEVSVILTGRDAPNELLELADTVTEMVKIRHAYDSGIAARRGIDF